MTGKRVEDKKESFYTRFTSFGLLYLVTQIHAWHHISTHYYFQLWLITGYNIINIVPFSVILPILSAFKVSETLVAPL